MPRDFAPPDFSIADVELRQEEGEVCIYATAEGLQKLAALCAKLADSRKLGHTHLEDYQLLTRDSLRGTIAVFEKVGQER